MTTQTTRRFRREAPVRSFADGRSQAFCNPCNRITLHSKHGKCRPCNAEAARRSRRAEGKGDPFGNLLQLPAEERLKIVKAAWLAYCRRLADGTTHLVKGGPFLDAQGGWKGLPLVGWSE